MKKYLFTSATVLFIGLTTYAQESMYIKKWYVIENLERFGYPKELRFEVRGRYTRPVIKEKLNKAKFLRDFISDYPTTWITDYVSVDILAARNGEIVKAGSANDVLSAEQKSILNTADLGTDIAVNVTYKSKNPATDKIENIRMHILVTVIPEVEAEYPGGKEKMKKYLRENVINKISATTSGQFQKASVIFIVNEQGETVNAKISVTSGDPETDQLLIDAINKMPDWSPAQNSMGVKVKQEFEFSIGGMDGC